MKTIKTLLLILIGTAASAATPDTALVNGNDIRLTKIDSITEAMHYQKSIVLENKVYSDEIVRFENNQMPIVEQDYKDQVRFLEFEIPMEYNDEIKKMINYFGTSWQSKFKEVLTLSQYYFPIYEAHLNRFRGERLTLMEIGIFSGGSLPMWWQHCTARRHISPRAPPAAGLLTDWPAKGEAHRRRIVEMYEAVRNKRNKRRKGGGGGEGMSSFEQSQARYSGAAISIRGGVGGEGTRDGRGESAVGGF